MQGRKQQAAGAPCSQAVLIKKNKSSERKTDVAHGDAEKCFFIAPLTLA